MDRIFTSLVTQGHASYTNVSNEGDDLTSESRTLEVMVLRWQVLRNTCLIIAQLFMSLKEWYREFETSKFGFLVKNYAIEHIFTK